MTTKTKTKIRVVNLPRTQTILALGVLAGCYFAMDDWRDLMLVIVGYYFGREMKDK